MGRFQAALIGGEGGLVLLIELLLGSLKMGLAVHIILMLGKPAVGMGGFGQGLALDVVLDAVQQAGGGGFAGVGSKV